MSSPPVERLVRLVLRPIGSPLPLGFAALGGASVVLSGLQLQWVPSSEAHEVAITLLVFAVPLQFLASVFGFLARDSVGGTGMGVLAGAWSVTGALVLASAAGSPSRTLGLLLFFAAAALMVPVAAATLGKVSAAIVMFGAGGRFVLTGIYEFNPRMGLEHISGWWGIGLCLIALYAAMAFEFEDTNHRTILPVGRRGAGRRALIGGIADEVADIQHEPGVRNQL